MQNIYEIRIVEQDKVNAEWMLYHLRTVMPYGIKNGKVKLLKNGQEIAIYAPDGDIVELEQ